MLRYGILGATALSALLLLDPRVLQRGRSWVAVTGVLAVLALTAGPASYTLATAATPHTGSTPASGPSGVARSGPGAGGGFGGARLGNGGGTPPAFRGTPPAGATGSFTPPTGRGGFTAGAGGPAGGGRSTNSALVTLLKQDSSIHTWAAATMGANTAASLQLASGQSVMAIGGFTGSDPSPTLARFQQLVANGQIHWFIAGGGMGGGQGGSSSTSSISTWVASHYTARTVGGQTVYDLTATSS